MKLEVKKVLRNVLGTLMILVRRSSVTGGHDAIGGEMARPTNLLDGKLTDASLRRNVL